VIDADLLDLFDIEAEQLELLTEDEQRELLEGLQALVGGETPDQFIRRLWYWEPPPEHVRPLLDVMQQARLRQLRICLSMPPGHAKTTMLLRCLVWWLSLSPSDLCAYVSYNERQALKKSRVCRAMALKAGLMVTRDNKAMSEWHLHQGGGLLAGGARSGLTGNRVPGLLVYDDPYKDHKDANSPTIRETVQENFKTVAFTRLQGGSIIVLHTRWHEDDLIGWLLKEHKWDHINVPAISQEGIKDALGRRPGVPAWPDKYPIEICTKPCGHDGHLAEIRTTIGEHWWNGMYEGVPPRIGTSVFHEPVTYRKATEFRWAGKRGCISVDPAATASTKADWSIIMVLAMEGYGIDTRMWIYECIRLQVEIPQLVRQIRSVQQRYNLLVVCEAVAGFKSVPQMLRDQDPELRVVECDHGGKDKFTRSQPVASAWNGGRVLVPNDPQCAEWVNPMVRVFRAFTGLNDLHDDDVDAAAHGWNKMYRAKPPLTQGSYEAVM